MEYKGVLLEKIDPYDVLTRNMEVFVCFGSSDEPMTLRTVNDGEDLAQYREDNRVIKMLHKMGYLYIKTKT